MTPSLHGYNTYTCCIRAKNNYYNSRFSGCVRPLSHKKRTSQRANQVHIQYGTISIVAVYAAARLYLSTFIFYILDPIRQSVVEETWRNNDD